VGSRETIEALRAFVAERDWEQFHTIPNLAKSVSIEAAELLEHFQWSDEFDVDEVKDELADVLTYCFLLADKLGVNPDDHPPETCQNRGQVPGREGQRPQR